MDNMKVTSPTRRRLMTSASALGVASISGVPRIAPAEPALETTKIRLVHGPFVCFAPLYLSEELMRLEGFPK